MANDDRIQEIEVSVMALGAAYAAALMGMIVWLAG